MSKKTELAPDEQQGDRWARGVPRDGPGFLDWLGVGTAGRAEQRAAVEDFMGWPTAAHMPKAVRDHLRGLGLLPR